MTTEIKEGIIRRSIEIINAADKIKENGFTFTTFSNGSETGKFLEDHRGSKPRRVMPNFLSYPKFQLVGEEIGKVMWRKIDELAAQEERRKIAEFLEDKEIKEYTKNYKIT